MTGAHSQTHTHMQPYKDLVYSAPLYQLSNNSAIFLLISDFKTAGPANIELV